MQDLLRNIFTDTKFSPNQLRSLEMQEAGTWNRRSYIMNLRGMGIFDDVKTIVGAKS